MAACEQCKENMVPLVVHEGAMARMERANKRLWIAVLVLIALLAVSNAAWVWYESQFEKIEITADQTADGEGTNYAIGGDFNGDETKSNNP